MRKIERVFIIDDDPIFVFGLQRFMKHAQLGDNFEHFVNGEIALQALKDILKNGEKLPDLIMIDLNMPVMDGWQFLEAFSKLDISIYPLVFIVSSSIDPHDMRQAKNYTMVKEFVVKPLTALKLKELVSTYQDL